MFFKIYFSPAKQILLNELKVRKKKSFCNNRGRIYKTTKQRNKKIWPMKNIKNLRIKTNWPISCFVVLYIHPRTEYPHICILKKWSRKELVAPWPSSWTNKSSWNTDLLNFSSGGRQVHRAAGGWRTRARVGEYIQ